MTTSNRCITINAYDVVLTLSAGQVTVQFAPKLETAVESPEERTEVAWEGAKQAEQAILAEFARVLGLPAAELKVSDVVAEVERRLRVSPGSTAAEWEDVSRYLTEMGIPWKRHTGEDIPLVDRVRDLLTRQVEQVERDVASKVRESIAEGLVAILYPGDKQPVLTLAQALDEVKLWMLKQGVPGTEAQVRDAALEDVVVRAEQLAERIESEGRHSRNSELIRDCTFQARGCRNVVDIVRALKSKPAPVVTEGFGGALTAKEVERVRQGKPAHEDALGELE
ncbi:hypothetical protein [Corallococcus sp. RDP092CA]|uniref:hypothetical protein n=1 Tax=Corallococcus sp. RDP092CA TaxID=3109369 RepID=UPI0035B40B95